MSRREGKPSTVGIIYAFMSLAVSLVGGIHTSISLAVMGAAIAASVHYTFRAIPPPTDSH